MAPTSQASCCGGGKFAVTVTPKCFQNRSHAKNICHCQNMSGMVEVWTRIIHDVRLFRLWRVCFFAGSLCYAARSGLKMALPACLPACQPACLIASGIRPWIWNRTRPRVLVQIQHTSESISLCTLYLHVCQVRVTVGDLGLCCCTCVMYFERWLTPLCVD